MNCTICKVEFPEHCAPREKTIEKFRAEYGKDFSGNPCPNCIRVFKQRNRNRLPINTITRTILRAIQADNYPAFAEAQLEAQAYVLNCENDISRAYSELDRKVKRKKAAMQLLDNLREEMSKSPRASYFMRRIEADKYIAKKEVRSVIFGRNNFQCVKCASVDDLTVDHIFPVAAGGTDHLDNLQTLCRSCNSSKGARVL